jgi:HD superfamily phosphodiesterase
MTRETYEAIEKIMLFHMRDSAHDRQHVYRVLRTGLEIAASHLRQIWTC